MSGFYPHDMRGSILQQVLRCSGLYIIEELPLHVNISDCHTGADRPWPGQFTDNSSHLSVL